MFADDPMAADAAHIAALACDISEIMADLGLKDATHADPFAHRLSRGLFAATWPADQGNAHDLLKQAGFTVLEPRDSHLCCGSAGTYNLMQP